MIAVDQTRKNRAIGPTPEGFPVLIQIAAYCRHNYPPAARCPLASHCRSGKAYQCMGTFSAAHSALSFECDCLQRGKKSTTSGVLQHLTTPECGLEYLVEQTTVKLFANIHSLLSFQQYWYYFQSRAKRSLSADAMLQFGRPVPRHLQFGSLGIVEPHEQFPAEPGVDFAHPRNVHQGGAVYAHELPRIRSEEHTSELQSLR